MRFRAKVLTSAMRVEFIELDASSDAEALRFVEAGGARLVKLQRIRSGMSFSSVGKAFNLSIFNQQLHALLDAGQPIVDAIDVLGRKDRKGRHRAIYDTMLQSLQHGKQLSEAMAAVPSVFPPLYVAMVKSSETTGSVRTSIKRFMQYQSQVDQIRSKLVAAAIYPAILLGVASVVVAFLMLYVLPRFSEVFEETSARNKTAPGFVAMWGALVRDHPGVAYGSIGAIFAGVAILAFNPSVRAYAGRKLLTAPWIGEKVWTLQLARMYRTMSMLLRSGVSVLAAMRMTAQTLPAAMQPVLLTAVQTVSEGNPMSGVMEQCGLSTEVAQQLLVAGESSGNLDEMMERIADFYDQEMAGWIDTTGRLIEPLLMVGIGMLIGLIVLTLYAPIFDLADAF